MAVSSKMFAVCTVAGAVEADGLEMMKKFKDAARAVEGGSLKMMKKFKDGFNSLKNKLPNKEVSANDSPQLSIQQQLDNMELSIAKKTDEINQKRWEIAALKNTGSSNRRLMMKLEQEKESLAGHWKLGCGNTTN